ncbi:hypothetical protein N9V62_00395 [Porticoccaceae bacterium]|nr:hypothetical protein [Porticoccaceae bacterium]
MGLFWLNPWLKVRAMYCEVDGDGFIVLNREYTTRLWRALVARATLAVIHRLCVLILKDSPIGVFYTVDHNTYKSGGRNEK